MSSEDMSLVPTRRLDGALSAAQLFFNDNGNNAHSLRFSFSPAGGNLPQRHVVGDVKTRELSGFVEDKVFSSEDRDRYFSPAGAPDLAGELRPSIYGGGETAERRGTLDIRDRKRGGAGWVEDENQDDEDDDEDEDEDADEEDSDEEGDIERMELVRSCILSGGDKTGGSDNDNIRNGHSRAIIPFGVPGNDANKAGTSKNSQQRGLANFQSMVTLADPDGDMYLPQFWHTSEGTSQGQKDAAGGDSGCGFSGRKDNSASINLGDTLRAIFSDPIKGVLMDDAMILPCGHSFGSGGMEHVIRMKSCYTCSQPVNEESVLPNLSLRAAVQAFRCEEEQICRASKRRRERVDQDKNNYPDLGHLDPHRGRGVQFPFAVADRVIIKGNKRTPQRFVGRKAVVTTQCLNGWYVVKTLDNAESVKLQYRSLAKVPDNSSSKMMLDKTTPHWL